MGGQGQSGEVRFAPHVEDLHKGWFNIGQYAVSPGSASMRSLLETNLALQSKKPFFSYEITDPDEYMSGLSAFQNSFEDSVDALSDTGDYDRIVSSIVAKVDQDGVLKDIDTQPIIAAVRTEASDVIDDAIAKAVAMVDDEQIAEIVEAFDKRSQHTRARAVRRFAGTMADINAVNSSAFLFGMAIIEAEHMQGVNEFNKELSLQSYKDSIAIHVDLYRQRLGQELQKELAMKSIRDQILMQSVQMTTQVMLTNIELRQILLNVATEVSRIKYVARSEYEGFDLDVKEKAARWDFETYKHAAVILGGMGGGQFIPNTHNRAGSAIGGALSGAASGAMAGSVVPGIGTALGAGIGTAMGLGAGLLN